jgi:hypothetical protein
MDRKKQGTLAEARKTLEPVWKCNGDEVADWVCPDGRKLGDHSGAEVGNLAQGLMHKARLHLRHARRLWRAAKRIGASAV